MADTQAAFTVSAPPTSPPPIAFPVLLAVVSRAASFVPGYVHGLVIAYVADGRHPATRAQSRAVLMGTIATLAVALIAGLSLDSVQPAVTTYASIADPETQQQPPQRSWSPQSPQNPHVKHDHGRLHGFVFATMYQERRKRVWSFGHGVYHPELTSDPRESGMDDDSPINSLVDAASRGDHGAWHELVQRFSPLLVAVIRQFRFNASETDDIAQTVWLRLVEHLGELREPRALPSWIVTTAKRESLRFLATQRRTSPYDPLEPGWLTAVTGETDEELLRAEREQALLAGLAELPSRQRELLLFLVEDPPLTYAEISERTGMAVGSIGPTRSRALERLRQTPAVRALMDGSEQQAGGDRRDAATLG
ncbi:MAG: RNA polymerase sigma factor [Micromonosporaceae bacterium]